MNVELDVDALVLRYLEGESINALAKALDVRDIHVRRILVSNGITIRDRLTAIRMAKAGVTEDPLVRYSRFIDRSAGPDACWPWTGGCDRGGYGVFTVAGRKSSSAHRWGFMNLVGPIPRETPVIRHICDNRPCQNPKHWILGTHADNSADMVARQRSRRGVSNPAAN